MTDLDALFVSLAALYVVECIAWVRRPAVAFRAGGGRRFRAARPSEFLGHDGAGVVWRWPWPPLGVLFVVGEGGGEAVTAGGAGADPDAATALADVRAEIERWRRAARPVRVAANVLFVALAVVTPAVAYGVGLTRGWPVLVALLWGASTLVAVLFARAHRALQPARRGERWQHALVQALAPLSALRAHDVLSRRVLARRHPLEAALVLLDGPERAAFARAALLGAGAARVAARTDSEAARPGGELARLRALAKAAGLDVDALVAAPTRAEPAAVAWCPRCEAQLTHVAAACPDCGEPELVPFTP